MALKQAQDIKEKREEIEKLKDMKKKLEELQALSDRAEAGDEEARRELRKVLRESSPEVIARASNFARRGQRLLADTISAGEPLGKEAMLTRLDLMRSEVAGENPTPLEVLLTERVVSSWLLVELFEVLMAGQLHRDTKSRVPLSYLKHMIRWQESATRHYLSAIRELARVRKLQSNTPGVQFNTQINLSGAGSLD